MSNTASPTRTDLAAEFAHAFPAARVATILAALLFSALLISFRPFAEASDVTATSGGDTINQLGFGALGALSLFGIFALVDRRVASALLSPWWLVMIGFVLFSVANSLDPERTIRAAAFTLIGIATVAAVLTLPRSADAFCAVLATAGLATIGLSYFGVVALPQLAIHQPVGPEAQHAGLWRGVFSHKNIAGPVMACLSFAGLYLMRRGWRWTGLLIFAGALIFVANTGSKTTVGLVGVAMLCVALPTVIGLRFLTPLILVSSMALAAVATLGMVFIPAVGDFMQGLFPGLTYTGRTAIWSFAGEMIARRPWTGYGLDSFWTTITVERELQPIDRSWDVRGIVHGHNGYLDIAVIMGLPALVFALVAFVVAPVRDYLRVPLSRENVLMADFFMMILLFTALNAFLESFFFRRADPVWIMFVFAALGLRLVARFPVRSDA